MRLLAIIAAVLRVVRRNRTPAPPAPPWQSPEPVALPERPTMYQRLYSPADAHDRRN